jgi:enoyl-CoA hydratase
VRAARTLDLAGTLRENLRLASRCMDGHDFYEGVRAAVIDKDHAPRWQPARLEDVSEEAVAAYFASLEGDELKLASRAEMQAVRR